MIKLNKERFFSAAGIFIIYMVAASLLIMGFRLVFPGEAPPLVCFSANWRLLQGAIDVFDLFPALALSGLAVPFGLKIRPQKKFTAFSPKFLQSLRSPILISIAAAGMYGALFFLALPAARSYEAGLRYQGRLYLLAKEQAQSYADLGEWNEAARLVAICEQIWPLGPDIEKLRTESSIRTEEARLAQMSPERTPGSASSLRPGLPDQRPLNAAEALVMAETAIEEERFYDAHWLAALGSRLAAEGSAETGAAARLASRAWNAVNSLEPTSRESRAYRIYRLKRDGYEALVSEDWIPAYYLFLELLSLAPEDPDIAKYLSVSEQGTTQAAFFTDEMELSIGEMYTDAVFSLPLGVGRGVMRLASLLLLPDSAYGTGAEILAFDREGRPTWRMEAPYVKILPFSLDSGPRISVLMRALDRTDGTKRWEPLVQSLGENAPRGAHISFSLSWDDFLLLPDLRLGPENLSVSSLMAASRIAGNYGYLPQVLEAEIIRRFAETAVFLPIAVLVLVIAWRYRALKRPRYLGIPMMAILPVVFNGAVHFYRSCLNNLGIWTVITFGFTLGIIAFAVGVLVFLILSLILLAAQHG
ncbi:MAG: hypothetical protein LBS48_06750 [Treponema sp.]|jgi:hypothetical protein|nr:hypothetical protein [Treponema sp.]